MAFYLASKAVWLVAVVFLSYLSYGTIYRLYLSPLARVPGPMLAALTGCYEMYYDLVEKARFPWIIVELHQKYGPIIRISPTEVHISDPAYAETHFGSKVKLNKYAPHQNQFGMPDSTFNTIDADLHKLRRGALTPFFSRRSTLALEPMILDKVEKTSSRLDQFKQSQIPVDLRLLFSWMTTDIITEYAFPHCFNLLDTPDLAPAWRNTFAEGLRNFQWFKHYPVLWKVRRSIPDHVLLKLSPEMKVTQDWERGNQKLVKDIVDSYNPHEKRAEECYERLWQEGSALIGAGVETTSNTLNVILFRLLTNPGQLERLKGELQQAMPNSAQLASWQRLETLPYLTAVIKEGLREALGTTSRFIRVAPDSELCYKDYILPPGTAVSMSVLLLHHHPSLFTEPESFIPERWLGKNDRADLFVFGRGPRMCAGQNLTHAELYLALAAIIRRFDLSLHETTYADIEPVCDAFMPMPRADTTGARVMVK